MRGESKATGAVRTKRLNTMPGNDMRKSDCAAKSRAAVHSLLPNPMKHFFIRSFYPQK